ncbi:Hypothetical protein SMAX5B_019782 [Scophthalmus maximus]|uniref:Uncharacterized protein n=1 Tax=Scophthalmus maximus TaxID=52904 RepID=A0A2U9BRY5_SCOMX|nr:Hypothetical protein SMAX5B_019782 [Scophthalmus maximus]
MNYSFSFMAFVDGGSGCRCKKIKTPVRKKQVSHSPAAEQEGGRVAQQKRLCYLCISLKLLFLFLRFSR